MKINKRMGAVMALTICFTMVFSSVAFAAHDKTYLAMGDNLSKSETKTVLQIFGVDKDDCEVIYVTNKDEHKYLDDYVDSAQIGTKALSCVMINENDGDEIDVETYNINYCTEDMYENALETAGVKGADVVVAGPYPISGTAALVGTIKAYEEMTGTHVSGKVVEAAVEELTTTGDIGEDVGNMDAVADIISDVKEELAENPGMSEEEIIQAIKDAAARAGISLSDANIEKIKNMISKFKGLDIDWGGLFNKAKDLGEKGYDAAKDMGIFDKIKAWIMSLLQ
ncbi:MAG: DUF1002 domain-containing protein [Clostridiales bacterium]|nr:DUF1002 domain-containing protein [Candidatus Crickella equi]